MINNLLKFLHLFFIYIIKVFNFFNENIYLYNFEIKDNKYQLFYKKKIINKTKYLLYI